MSKKSPGAPWRTASKIHVMTFVWLLISVPLLLGVTTILLLSARDRSLLSSRSHTFSVNGDSRRYLLSLPKTVTPDTRIVVGLHAFGDSARRFAYYTGLHNALPNDILVYPQAKPSSTERTGWNVGFCCGSGWKQNTQDVDFILALTDEIAKNHDVSNQFFVAGFSNGAMMAQRLAAEHPERVIAFASAAGTLGTTTTTSKPQAATHGLLMHGSADTTVPFNGGYGSYRDFEWLSAEQTEARWKKTNGCDPTTGSSCTKTIQTEYTNLDHRWPGWRIWQVWHTKTEGSVQTAQFFNGIRS